MLPRPGIRGVPTDPTPSPHPPILMVEPTTEALGGKSIWFLFSFSSLLTWWSLKSGGLSKPNLHIDAREGGSISRAWEWTGEGRRTRRRRKKGGWGKVLRRLWGVLRRLWGMVRSITGHHRCSLVSTNAPRHQGTRVTRLLEHSPCPYGCITTCSRLLQSSQRSKRVSELFTGEPPERGAQGLELPMPLPLPCH